MAFDFYPRHAADFGLLVSIEADTRDGYPTVLPGRPRVMLRDPDDGSLLRGAVR
jgi:hypothetical protein